MEWIPHILSLATRVELVACGISRKFYRVQNPNPTQELRNEKTLKLTLDCEDDMANIVPLEELRVHSYGIIVIFHSWGMNIITL